MNENVMKISIGKVPTDFRDEPEYRKKLVQHGGYNHEMYTAIQESIERESVAIVRELPQWFVEGLAKLL